ncbi:MAG TPA: DUF456 domain-containing protein [Saprospiraceae bacterium]|nr:DUF456 domain-containing protein [Saprospiraceae bacterium]
MIFDIVLLILGLLLLLIGLAGSILPIPGPPLTFFGLILIHWSRFADFTSQLLWILGIATIVVTALDLMVPAWGVSKFGGSRYGIWGSMIGLTVGIFTGPWGIFIGAFAGGLIGEMMAGRDYDMAMKAAFGSFIGFLLGALLKIILSGIIIWYAVKGIIFAN